MFEHYEPINTYAAAADIFRGLSVCVDDYGESVYLCRYTYKLVWASDGIVVGSPMPGTGSRFVMENSDNAKNIRKASERNFHESEKNCNTCSSLSRGGHKKCKHGFLEGWCNAFNKDIKFHPHDPMHMECYRPRIH